MSVSLGGFASLRHGRTGRHAAVTPMAGSTCAHCAVGSAALLIVAALAVTSGRWLLAGLCVGAGLPFAVGATGVGRRGRGAIEALALAAALGVYGMHYGGVRPWPASIALTTIALLGAVTVALEAARRATLARRGAWVTFWLLAALLAAAGYLHLLARSWRDVLAVGAAVESDVLAYLALTSAHAGYASFGIALLLGLLARTFGPGTPAPARAVAVAERWHLIAAAGIALVALVSIGRPPV